MSLPTGRLLARDLSGFDRLVGYLILASLFFLLLAALVAPCQARVTRIVTDETKPYTQTGGPGDGSGLVYEQIAGPAFGELDPTLPGNALIQDIELAKDADGKVRYVVTFVIIKPVDMKPASGLLWHEVPNRGRVFSFAPQESAAGDVILAPAPRRLSCKPIRFPTSP